MSDDAIRLCGYWTVVKITPEDVEPARYGLRCVAANAYFTGEDWGPEDIDCFNEDTFYSNTANWIPIGFCDGDGGRNGCWKTCNRYHASGLGFGKLDPVGDSDVEKFLLDNDQYQPWTAGRWRLPFKHQVYNLRAKISKCCYWDANQNTDFEIDADTGQIASFTTQCIYGSLADRWRTPEILADYNADFDLPCNGAKPECLYYTGINWEYCIDDKMQEGDEILAAQVQELRYWSDEWSDYTNPYDVFRGRFVDPDIYAWFYNTETGRGKFYSVPPGETTGEETDYPVPDQPTLPILDKTVVDLDDGEISASKRVPTTGTKAVEGSPQFPTLITALQGSVPLRPRIFFPYKDYVHKYWTPDGAKVTVIGDARIGSTIYIVNDKIHKVPAQVKVAQAKEAVGTSLSTAERELLDIVIENFLTEIKTYFSDDYVEISPDATSGYFLHEAVDVVQDSEQDIYVFVDDGTNYQFASVNFESKFYHNFPIQTRFDAQSWTEDYVWNGTAEGIFHQGAGRTTVAKFFWRWGDLAQTYSPLVGFGNLNYHSYRIVKTEEVEFEVDDADWWPLTSCGEVLVRIDDLDINRVEGWEITSAIIEDDDDTIELEASYPSNLSSLNEYFPANHVVLESKSDQKVKQFVKSETTLTIKYRRLEERPNSETVGENEEIVYPSAGSNIALSDTTRYTSYFSDTNWDIENIYEWQPIFKAFFREEDGRIVGAKTFKLLIQTKEIKCRDYEINYIWNANYTLKKWHPSIWCGDTEAISFSESVEGTSVRSNTPLCGDHDLGHFYQINIGPMWYPYTACDQQITYRTGEIGNICALPVEGNELAEPTIGYWNHRLRGPDDNYAETFGDPNPAIFACRLPYQYGYAEKAGYNMFAGHGAPRGEVDLLLYRLEEWTPPQFGNVLREQSLLNRSIDFAQYFDPIDQAFYWKWMPCLEEYSEVEDIFSEEVIHPFTFMLATSISDSTFIETINPDREKWNDILYTRHSSSAPNPGTIWYPYDNIWYHFINIDISASEVIQWAYREVWKDVEREALENKDAANSLPCIDLDNVEYKIDRYKTEYQAVPNEGEYVVLFSAPQFDEFGTLSGDAYFRILPGPPRFLDLETLTWKDDAAMLGGSEITPVYSTWNGGGGEWDSYPNLWAESVSQGTKVEAESKGNKYTTYDSQIEEESDHYFFKGLNVSIRNVAFPYQESGDLSGLEYNTQFRVASPGPDHPSKTVVPDALTDYNASKIFAEDGDGLAWSDDQKTNTKEITLDIGNAITLSELRIYVYVGRYDDEFVLGAGDSSYVAIVPNITISAANDIDGPYTILETIVGFDYDYARGRALSLREFKYEQDPTNTIVFANKYRYYKINFADWSDDGAVLFVSNVKMKKVDLVNRSETIKTWEHKFYKTTTLNTGDFTYYGTESYYTMSPSEDDSTIYLDESKIQGLKGRNAYATYHKTRARAGGQYYNDYEGRIDRTGSSNTCTLEQQQELLWTDARNRTGFSSSFSYNLPQVILDYLDEYDVSFPISETLILQNAIIDLRDVPIYEHPSTDECESWSGSGHKYVNSKHLIWREVCGGIGTPWAYRAFRWTCDYCFKHLNHFGYHGETDECNLAINPAVIYSNIIVPATIGFSELPELRELFGPDIRTYAARDYIAGSVLRGE